jgi:hypothetical protein
VKGEEKRVAAQPANGHGQIRDIAKKGNVEEGKNGCVATFSMRVIAYVFNDFHGFQSFSKFF